MLHRTCVTEQALGRDRPEKIGALVGLEPRRKIVHLALRVPRHGRLKQRILHLVNVALALVPGSNCPHGNIFRTLTIADKFVNGLATAGGHAKGLGAVWTHRSTLVGATGAMPAQAAARRRGGAR